VDSQDRGENDARQGEDGNEKAYRFGDDHLQPDPGILPIEAALEEIG
jgi:hypothetical protein